jgi:hypothetical protein
MILDTDFLIFKSISEVFSPSKGTLVEIFKGGMTAGTHKPELTLVEKLPYSSTVEAAEAEILKENSVTHRNHMLSLGLDCLPPNLLKIQDSCLKV